MYVFGMYMVRNVRNRKKWNHVILQETHTNLVLIYASMQKMSCDVQQVRDCTNVAFFCAIYVHLRMIFLLMYILAEIADSFASPVIQLN